MSDLGRVTRNRIADILRKYQIVDECLEVELIDACFFVRSWQPQEHIQDKSQHPALLMCKRVTGFPVPSILWEELITFFGDAPNEDEYREAFRAWVAKGKDPKDYTWRKWARSKRQNWNDGRPQPVTGTIYR